MRTYLRLLRQRRFSVLCAGQAISLLGDALFPMIVVAAAAGSSDPASTIGVVFAARFAALGGGVLFGGALLDRYNPVTAAVAADSTRVVALIALAMSWDGGLDAVVVSIALIVGACEAVSEPALLLIAPRTVTPPAAGVEGVRVDTAQESETTALYGLLQGMRRSAGVVGPSLAAALVAALNPSIGAVAAAVTFGVSAFATRWAGARYTERRRLHAKSEGAARDNGRPPAVSAEQEPTKSLLQAALGGLAVLWRVRWLRHVQVLAVIHVVLAVGPWMVALPVFVIESGYSTSVYALVLGAFAAGTVLGALVGGRITGPRRGLYALILLAFFGLTAMSPVLVGSVWLVTAAFVIGGIGQQSFAVVKLAGLRRDVPERLHGRAFSADFFFSFASLPLGQAFGAVLLQFVGPDRILVGAGVLVIVTTCVTMLGADVRRFASAVPRPEAQGMDTPRGEADPESSAPPSGQHG